MLLERRSLVVMHREARYRWHHRITKQSRDVFAGREVQRSRRVSLTFRRVILETVPPSN